MFYITHSYRKSFSNSRRRGSRYDGHMERTADRIMEVLTPEMRRTIL
jgi:hypothetical protein